jgi:hypothetical protein
VPPDDEKKPSEQEDIMTHYIISPDFEEFFEYHGNVAIERVRLTKGRVERDWLYFDSAEEAVDFFTEQCV